MSEKEKNTKTVAATIAMVAVAGMAYGVYRLAISQRAPASGFEVNNFESSDIPEYTIRDNQTFEGGEYYDDCPGAMVGWKLYSIHSRALRNKGAEIGDVIRIYAYGEGGIKVIDKIAVITDLPGLRTAEVNRYLWSGENNETKPELRKLQWGVETEQSHNDARLYHLRITHLGKIINMDRVRILPRY